MAWFDAGDQRSTRARRRHPQGEGFPQFRHNQWTFEGEIERLGAFGRGGARARGKKRLFAILVLFVFVLPLAVAAVQFLSHIF